MKANNISTETLLHHFPSSQWGIAWEALMDATNKKLDFETPRHLFSYIKTYIYRKDFNETYYHRRTKTFDPVTGAGSVRHEYIMRSLPVTHAMAVYGISKIGDDDDYEEMIAGATVECADDTYAEVEMRIDLSALGIPDYFIDRIFEGERITRKGLSEAEVEYLQLCRSAFSDIRKVRA
jgi:hypothetical protein